MPTPRSILLSSLVLVACGDASETGTSSTGTTSPTSGVPTSGDASADETNTPNTTSNDEVAGLDLLPRLAGLWSGPATMTPLGTFKRMNMDLRAASGQVLFARADLDVFNSLRFAFEVEAPGGAPTLVYRNGGYFLGLLRDSRTALVEQGDLSGATKRIKDLEIAWDGAEAGLKPRAASEWHAVDKAIDRALSELRAATPNAKTSGQSLKDLLVVIDAK